MATCMHGNHWDGISKFHCPQCSAIGTDAAGTFFSIVAPNVAAGFSAWTDKPVYLSRMRCCEELS